MIQNFPYKQNQTLIDLQKLKSQINLILANFERKDELKSDVKDLNTSEYSLTDFNEMTNLKSFINSLISSSINLENDVKQLFKTTYDNDDFNDFTNFVSWLNYYYEQKTNLKNDISTLLTSIYDNNDYNNFTSLNNYLSKFALISSMNTYIKTALTSGISEAEFSTLTNFDGFVKSFVKYPINIITCSSSDYNGRGTNYETYTTYQSNNVRVIYCALAPDKNYDNHIFHLFFFKNLDSSVSSGNISNYINFLPSDTNYYPYIIKFGDFNYSYTGTPQIKIRIAKKEIIINFPSGIWTTKNSCYHISFTNCYQINFDDYIKPIATTLSYNPFYFDVSSFGTNPGTNNIWDQSDHGTWSIYHVYDYNNEPNTLNLTAYRFDNGSW